VIWGTAARQILMTMMSNNIGQFGDTTLTKVFVGGLAWETPKEAMREHFEKYGEILEAVIISDKVTGRSKGYGFVSVANPWWI
jgi:RNA recognition motif-containing protein